MHEKEPQATNPAIKPNSTMGKDVAPHFQFSAFISKDQRRGFDLAGLAEDKFIVMLWITAARVLSWFHEGKEGLPQPCAMHTLTLRRTVRSRKVKNRHLSLVAMPHTPRLYRASSCKSINTPQKRTAHRPTQQHMLQKRLKDIRDTYPRVGEFISYYSFSTNEIPL